MTAEPRGRAWFSRGHGVNCWEYHESCALLSACDLLDARAAHIKAQAGVFRTAVRKLEIDTIHPDWLLTESARRLLREYHQDLRSGRAR